MQYSIMARLHVPTADMSFRELEYNLDKILADVKEEQKEAERIARRAKRR